MVKRVKYRAARMIQRRLKSLPDEVRVIAESMAYSRIAAMDRGRWTKIDTVLDDVIKKAWSEVRSFEVSLDAPIGDDPGNSSRIELISSNVMPVLAQHKGLPKNPRVTKVATRNCKNCKRKFSGRVKKNKPAASALFCSAECQRAFYRRGHTKLHIEAVVADIAAGLSRAEIARKYGASFTAVTRFLKMRGIRANPAKSRCIDCSNPPEIGANRCSLHKRLAIARTRRNYFRRKKKIPKERWMVEDVSCEKLTHPRKKP